MKIEKCLAGFMVLATTVLLTIPVSAAETTDKPFSIPINTTSDAHIESTTNPVRIKTDSSSTYIKSSDTGPSSFVAIIYGCDWRGLSDMDCTSNYIISDGHGGYRLIERPPAVVKRGTRGFVRQDVYERNYPYAKLKGQYHNGIGTAKGVWSPDSVYEPIGDYNN